MKEHVYRLVLVDMVTRGFWYQNAVEDIFTDLLSGDMAILERTTIDKHLNF